MSSIGMRSSAMRFAAAALAALALGTTAASPAASQTRLLRFPDIHGDRVVFTYAGDLWSVADTGGTAIRLTAHPGLELFPRFSPSGDRIAFTGQYDGDEQVYVIPASGGEPRQLTFYPANGPLPARWGYDHQVYGWSPDGESILFRSLRDGWTLSDTNLFTVPADGGLPRRLPMPRAGAGDFSPDGNRLAYAPLFRDFRAWKRYAGGWAEDLWVFDLESEEARQITDHRRTERDPMWIGSRIYFDSDRSGTLNLYSVRPDGTDLRQHTDHATWDVRWPAADRDGRIVYELGGELRILDTRTGEARDLEIHVPDDGLHARPHHGSVAEHVEGFAVAPGGARTLFVARGDVFSVPARRGSTHHLTASSSAHDREARWSPDGRRVAFISDMSGEEELYLVEPDGTGEPEALTTGGEMRRMNPVWSPDNDRIAFADKLGRLWVVDANTRDLRMVARDSSGVMYDHAWSPDGRWLAYSTTDAEGFRSIWVQAMDEEEPRRVTGPMTNDFEPAFSRDGSYLFFLSDRGYAPLVSSHDWDFATDRETRILALALTEDTPPPFPPRSDAVVVEGPDSAGGTRGGGPGETDGDPGGDSGAGAGEGTTEDATEVRIDFDDLSRRVTQVPVEADNYRALTAVDGGLLFERGGGFYYGRAPARSPELIHFDLEERRERTVAEEVQGHAVSPDGSHVLVRSGGEYRLHDLSSDGDDGTVVSTSGLEADIVPREEWAQIFDEVWRRFRDYFYVANMNGYDWEGLRDQYRPLLEHVRHRADLNYLIGEMIAELSQSHAYIAGGDLGLPDRPEVALPGVRFRLDEDSGRYRIADILEGDNAETEYRAPLTEIGVDARVGDYVLAVDGQELRAPRNPYELLRHKADRPVSLSLAASPDADQSEVRSVRFEPRTGESDLIYHEWVESNRARVDSLSDGRVGYLHLPDMGEDGIAEFVKWFYPQVRKEGLVVDVRGNGGGNVSSMVLERLSRTLLASRYFRNSEYTSTYPRGPVFHGHLAAVLNETSASDGDIFPAMFREAGLGPLVGQRSWGGITGILNRGPLLDGGSVFVPEVGFTSLEGEWIIEGRGVEPDIVVENHPEAVLEGRDPQLERAVEEVLREIREDPRSLPERPAPPDRTGGY